MILVVILVVIVIVIVVVIIVIVIVFYEGRKGTTGVCTNGVAANLLFFFLTKELVWGPTLYLIRDSHWGAVQAELANWCVFFVVVQR